MLNSAFSHLQRPAKCTYLLQKSERCIHGTKVSMLSWNKSQDKWIKINTDECALTDPGKHGAGGILRDKEVKMLMAFTTPLGEATNNRAKFKLLYLVLLAT